MHVIYNLNETVDLMATREALEGCLSEEEMEEDELFEDSIEESIEDVVDEITEEINISPIEEFFSDPCWAEPPGLLG